MVEFTGRKRFSFVSQGMPEDTFEVVRFRGEEGISRLFHFDIVLISEEPEVDIDGVLQNPAVFTIHRGEEDRKIHGIVSEFEQMHEVDQYTFYQASLVPRLWLSDLYRENQLFLDKSVPEIIEEILKQAGLTSKDYELKLTRNYPKWEYICQYKETDLNFISRWMEREGIYYYFEHTDEGEKLIVTDSSTAHTEIEGEATIPYSPPSALIPEEEEVIRHFMCRQKVLPKKIILKDYNYRKPSLDLKVEKEVNPRGRGVVYLYGEHFKDPEQGKELAKLRAEQIACRGKLFMGESTCPQLCPGFFFELTDHYRDSFNQKYLVIELEHEGSQAATMLAGLETQEAEGEKEPAYLNRFTLIPSDVQFRPEVKTPKPRFYGTINAKIDASGDGKYAEIDDQGRYKVILPFDMSGREGGKASRWIRMAQPYAGADYGMHFPLHKGAEVLLTFVDGDPDRPIIAAAVPNPDNKTPVTSKNSTQCVVRTSGGNEIKMENKEGTQMMKLHSPTDKTFVRIGAGDSGGKSGIEVSTQGHQTTRIEQKRSIEVGADTDEHYKANVKTKIIGDRKTTVVGRTESTHLSDSKTTTTGNREIINTASFKLIQVGQSEQTKAAGERALYVGQLDITGIAGNTSIWVGTKSQITIALASEIYVGGKSEVFVGMKSSVNLIGASEIFIGFKSDIKLAGLLELTAGAKLAINLGVFMELTAGVKIANEPGGEIKTEPYSITTSGISQNVSGITNIV